MTVGEIVDKLGGTKAVSEIFDVGQSAVSNWRKAGNFPAWAHLRLSRLADARGIKIPHRLLQAKAPPGRKAKAA